MMIHKTKIGPWRLFFTEKKYADAFAEIFDRIERRSGTVLSEDTESRRPRLVLKTEIPHLDAETPFVLKREWFHFRPDRTAKSFFGGSNARILFKSALCAEKQGFSNFSRIFLVAERFRFGILRETISLIEFLDGHTLEDEGTLLEGNGGSGWMLPAAVKKEAKTLLENCHRCRIVSGDVHPGNFFRTQNDGKLKLIDFRGSKLFFSVAAARDRVQMEYLMNIPNTKHDWGEKFFRAHLSFRNFFRRRRGLPLHKF